MYDLLNDDLIGVQTPEGARRVNLPALFGLLARSAVDAYTGLRAHQADPWHVFLVQLAASIQARSPTPSLPGDPAYWRDGLLDLAGGRASAWSLMVEDVTLPAFLQHPWKSWKDDAKAYKAEPRPDPKASTPDELDVLVTAKNHDLKMSRAGPQSPEAWLYALLLYQTTSGFLGQGNYGIIRMNGGFASRPIVSWCANLHPARRFQEEVAVLAAMREKVTAAYACRPRGVVLTWLEPWKRDSHQYVLQDLEPWFIEAARPVRLRQAPDGSLFALGATSKARQIGPKSLENGDVGDPWIPLNVQDKKKGRSALTVSAAGFTPQLMTNLIFEQGYELTELQRPRPGSEPGWFVGSVLARGQGTTEGYHRIALLVPAKARMALFQPPTRSLLAKLAECLLVDAKGVAEALRTALVVFAEGGPEKADFGNEALQQWVRRLDSEFAARWEQRYFSTLWRAVDEDHEAIRSEWQRALAQQAESILNEARSRLPLPSARYYRAMVQARSAFLGGLRKRGLPLPTSSTTTQQQEEFVV